MYTVHVKSMTATHARRNFFAVLDEVASGGEVVIESKGRRIVLRREEATRTRRQKIPDYSKVIGKAEDIEDADLWTWRLDKSGQLVSVKRKRR